MLELGSMASLSGGGTPPRAARHAGVTVDGSVTKSLANDGKAFLSALHLNQMEQVVLRVLFIQFLVSVVVGAAMALELPARPVLLWLGMLWLALTVRAFAVRRASADASRLVTAGSRRLLAVSSLALGLAWGCSLFLFPAAAEGSFAEKLLIYVLIAVAGAGSVLHAPQPRIARAFVLATMVPPITIRVLCGGPQDLILAATGVVYVSALFGVVKHLEGIMRSVFVAQAENADLAGRLEQEARQRLAIMEDTLLERRRMERELAGRERELRTLMASMPDVVVRYDPECRRTYISPSYEPATGVREAPLLGTRPTDACGALGEGADSYEKRLREVMRTGEGGEFILEWLSPDGEHHCHMVTMVPEFDSDGGLVSVLTVGTDVGELKRAEALAHAREEAFRSLAENTPDGIARFDRERRLIYVNPALTEMSGLPAETLLGMRPADFADRDWAAQLEAKLQESFAGGAQGGFEVNWFASDDARCLHLRLVPERDRNGEIASVLAVGRDITEIDGYRRRIASLAFYDGMTGLPNRILLHEQAETAIREGARHGRTVAVMLLDLDRFKTINDTLGHATGDQLLREAGARLLMGVRASDMVARLGGDEFAILLPEVRDASDVGNVAHKLQQLLGEPFSVDGRDLFVSASIGVAFYPDDGLSWSELLQHADSAMYHAKALGRNNFQFYRAEMTRRAEERLRIEARLRKALANDEFDLKYHPLVSLRNGAVIGAEVLLRWNNGELGDVPPDRFIPVAEDTGLILEIGAWVLREACRSAAAWNTAGRSMRVSVNLSTRQFRSRELVSTVLNTVAATGCRPEWLELEITESLLLEDSPEVRETMAELRARGFRFTMDDFGTGYSALGYLRRFPIETIKIDRSFIPGITTDGNAAALVRAIISMAEALDLGVVAEGVETPEQCKLLRAWAAGRPVLAQGDLFGEPMGQAEFERKIFEAPPRRCGGASRKK